MSSEESADALIRQATEAFRQGRFRETAATYRRLVTLVPAHAHGLADLAGCLLHIGETKEAERASSRALAIFPKDINARSSLAIALLSRRDLAGAVRHFSIASALAPADAALLSNLGFAEFESGNAADAARSLRRSVALNPSNAPAHNNLGIAQFELDRAIEAEASHDRALALRPLFPEAHWNRGLRRLARGDFARGWPDAYWRWRCAGVPGLRYSDRAWDGEDPAGRKLLLYGEQGFGDTIQFARFAGLLTERGARVMLQCQRPLVRLLSSLPKLDVVVPDDEPPPVFDIQAPLMDVPGLIGVGLADLPGRFPYLAADPSLAEIWRSRLSASKPKVGLVWQGNPTSPSERGRSIPLSHLAPLLARPGIAWYSVQHGSGREQVADLPSEIRPEDLGQHLRDFADTAAVLANLDLVFTTCTSVAHLAGALGRPTWVMLRHAADWRWMTDRNDSPWYPSVRLFRQSVAGDWTSVVRAMDDELTRSTSIIR